VWHDNQRGVSTVGLVRYPGPDKPWKVFVRREGEEQTTSQVPGFFPGGPVVMAYALIAWMVTEARRFENRPKARPPGRQGRGLRQGQFTDGGLSSPTAVNRCGQPVYRRVERGTPEKDPSARMPPTPHAQSRRRHPFREGAAPAQRGLSGGRGSGRARLRAAPAGAAPSRTRAGLTEFMREVPPSRSLVGG
jgi:hypothetical protein